MSINNTTELLPHTYFDGYSRRRNSTLDKFYGYLRLLVIIVENVYCVSSYLVLSWLIFLPIYWLRSDLYSKLENKLYNSLLFIVSSWSLAAGATVVELGDDFSQLIEHGEHERCKKQLSNGNNDKNFFSQTNKMVNGIVGHNFENRTLQQHSTNSTDDESEQENSARSNELYSEQLLLYSQYGEPVKPRILFLCNHISTADVPLLMQSFSTLTKQNLLWVLDAQFKYTNFGLVCSSHGDYFISKGTFAEGSLREQCLRHPDRNLMVLFPEGGFLRKRIEGSNRYAQRSGLPLTKYVSHPRFGAFKDLIDPNLQVTHVVDATLLYDKLDDPISILDIAFATRKEPVIVHYRLFDRNKIDLNTEWLEKIWMEKEKLMEMFYEDRQQFYKIHTLKSTTNKASTNDENIDDEQMMMRVTRLNWIKVFTVHIFYLLLCYLAVYKLFIVTCDQMMKAKGVSLLF